jgi:AraC-like DNA-binding protein
MEGAAHVRATYSFTIGICKLPGEPKLMTGPAGSQTTESKSRFIVFEDRPSESPFVERIWRCHSERGGAFLSVAASHFEMAVTRHRGKVFLTLRGPETKATSVDCPAEGEWLGIRFKLGTFMPRFLPGSLRDQKDVTLPSASSRSFWLNSSAWHYPDFDNAETFIKRLAKAGVISRDSAVDAALQGRPLALSVRSTQRHFLLATGVTHATVRQIERARYATNLLREGVSILDAVHLAGYFDQAHLTRSLQYLIGQTPTKIIRGEKQLSFLYKTEPT